MALASDRMRYSNHTNIEAFTVIYGELHANQIVGKITSNNKLARSFSSIEHQN